MRCEPGATSSRTIDCSAVTVPVRIAPAPAGATSTRAPTAALPSGRVIERESAARPACAAASTAHASATSAQHAMRRQEYISPRLYDVCRMTQRAPVMAILILVVASTTASAQTAGTSGPAPDRNPFLYLFHNIVLDAKRLPSVETAVTLGAGGALALAVHPADDTVSERATAGGPRDF